MKRFWPLRGISKQASTWFARIKSKDIGRSESAAWAQWMDSDVQNQKAFEQAELAWEIAAELEHRPKIDVYLKDIDALLERKTPARARPAMPAWPRAWTVAMASAATLIVGSGALWYWQSRVAVTEYNTAVGEQRVVSLADHSVVTLNTATRLRVLYSRRSRRVELLAGEALFEVTKDSRRPFEVQALLGVTTAVGTKFDIQIQQSDVAVLVLEGAVAVEAGSATGHGPRAAVAAGQALTYTASGTLSAIRSTDGNRVLAWQKQRIIFNDTSLADALAEYNRYITTPIVLGDSELGSRRINGVFRIGEEDAFLHALEQALPVKATRRDSEVVLQRR
jgi:transmembrane sensor